MAMGLETRVSLGWIALLRVVAGGILLEAGIRKLRLGFDGAALGQQLEAWRVGGQTFGFYVEVLQGWVVPNLSLFAALVVAAELLAGLSLVLGIACRLVPVVALLLHVNYFLASGETINVVLAVVNLAVLSTAAGRAMGLDRSVRARRPGWFLG